MKPYRVFTNFRESEFQSLKGHLKERYELINKPVQPGTKEALQIDTPEGKITITYYKNCKLNIQSSTSNPEYVWLENEISKYFSSLQNQPNLN